MVVLKREEILKKKLEREQKIIVKWKEARNVATNIILLQGMETFCKRYLEREKEKMKQVDGPTTDDESTDSIHPLKEER